ncbi:MAG: FMN-binding protein [Faecalibacterium sp.]
MKNKKLIQKAAVAVAMSLIVAIGLAACGGSKPASGTAAASETKTGKAEGFGGDVIVTLTVADGTITDCVLEGADETPAIGGAALEELAKQVVAANGPEIDGVAGATVTTKAVKKAVAEAMGVALTEEAPAASAAPAPAEPAARVEVEGGIQIGQAYAAAHGTKCYTQAVAVVKDDVILAAYIDDFQFGAADSGVTPVPNGDGDFAAGFAEGKVLYSKRVNADYYSKNMADKAGSTVAIDANFDAVQNFAVGKTIAELEEVAAKGEAAVDAVSGATLADTAGYLNAIVAAAKNAQDNQAVEYTGSSDDLKLNVVYAAAHGTKCFTSAAAVTAGDTIVLSYIDEFQFGAPDSVTGVPNSDSDFAAGYAEGKVLFSKRENAEYYSKNMAEKAGSTVALDANYDAIQNHVNGMSIADAEKLSQDANAVDAVSGATLADTAGYVGAIVAAAQQ